MSGIAGTLYGSWNSPGSLRSRPGMCPELRTGVLAAAVNESGNRRSFSARDVGRRLARHSGDIFPSGNETASRCHRQGCLIPTQTGQPAGMDERLESDLKPTLGAGYWEEDMKASPNQDKVKVLFGR